MIERLNTAWSSMAQWFGTFLGMSFRERLEVVLRELGAKFGVRDTRGVLLMPELAHADLADMIGSSRPMVSRPLHRVVDSGAIAAAQVVYNLLNPSVGAALAPGFPAHDFGDLLGRTRKANVGVICIRVLAAGALSCVETRHPLGSPVVEPIASGADYHAMPTSNAARQLGALVREGYADSLIEGGAPLCDRT